MKKQISIFLTLAMVLSSFFSFAVVSAETAVPEGYTEIKSAQDFELLRANPSGKYYLTEDIILPSNYKPIPEFCGELIGADEVNLKTITMNVTVSDASKDAGLFGKLRKDWSVLNAPDVKIKNIKLLGSLTVSASIGKIGGLAGNSANFGTSKSEISNCVSDVTITVTQPANTPYIGGLIGYACGGVYNGLINTGDIVTDGIPFGYVGGIFGFFYNYDSYTVTSCENYGDITVPGWSETGGIVANAQNKKGTISNCYSAGNVNAAHNGAGIAYDVTSTNGLTVTNCYSISSVMGSYETNPIVSKGKGAAIKDCCYLSPNGHDDGISGTEPLTLTQMRAQIPQDTSETF